MDWNRLDPLLDALLDLPEAERAARLDELARERPEEAARLRELLDPGRGEPDLDRVGALVEAAAADEPGAAGKEPGGARLPGPIGPWEPLELIASGGMGDVYRVRRADGEYRETAALKRLRRSVGSTTARARFVLERQLLADLRHPHIATLLDGGVDPEGVPYFVMEFVDGPPIDEHCDAARLGLEARLRLFEQVTGAVVAAHQRLVVHRDLKPGNILVASSGGVKLVDFGIAKLLDEPPETGVTETWERILTPRYAAPEQIAGAPVTTATDVYALGVVLHELLSGCLPRSERELRAALAPGARLSDPPAMSTTFGRLAQAAPLDAESLAARRGTTVRNLGRRLRGDLDAIVAKALRTDPEDRYATVASLAADLARVREARPVEAHRGSWLYRARKFWTRHWLTASAAVLVVASLAVGLSVALVKSRAAQIAEGRAAAINRFLTEELLGSADPGTARGHDPRVREIVANAARNVGLAFAGQPAIEASVRRTLGTLSARLGELTAAREQLTAARALLARAGADRLERARLARAFAELALAEGRYDAARSEIRSAVDALTLGLGPDAGETLDARILAGRILTEDGDVLAAERTLRDAAGRLDRAPAGRAALRAAVRSQLALALTAQGRRDEALQQLQEASRIEEVALGPDHPQLAQTLEQIADIESWIGRNEDAEATARRALEIDRKVFGPSHWRTLHGAYVLAAALYRDDRLQEASSEAASALAAAQPVLGDDHPEVVNLENTLAVFDTRRGDFASAADRYRDALSGAERGIGAAADTTMMIRRNFSNFLALHGDREESLRLARKVRAFGLEAAGRPAPDPMYLANVAWFLATAELPAARDLDAALELGQRAVDASRGRWYYPWVALSEVHSRRGELDAAIDAERHAVSLPDGMQAGEARYLVELLMRKGDLAGAESFLHERMGRLRSARPPGDPLFGHTRALLGRVLLAAGRLDEAEVELRAALAQYDRKLAPDHEWRVPALSDLGALLSARGSWAEAAKTLEEARRIAAKAAGDSAPAERALIEERWAAVERAGAAPGAGPGATPAPPASPGGGAAMPAP
jgi:serine/threonine protein kinase